MCGAIAQMGGYPVDLTGVFYTGNFPKKLKAAGFTVYRYTSLKAVKPGDFLVTPGHHVEFVYDKSRMWSAHNDERGKSVGGRAGDQTGRETGFRTLSQRPGSGWTYIVRPPKAPPKKPVDTTKPSNFEFGTANLWAQRFGGPDDDSPARGKFLRTMGCSVFSLQEVSEDARNAIREALPGGKKRWKVQEVGYVCVLWDSTKWSYGEHKVASFETRWHGAVRQRLIRKANGRPLDVVALHVRPNDAIGGSVVDKVQVKLRDLRKALNLVTGEPTILAGDFNTSHARKYMVDHGWTPVTDAVDTADMDGEQKLDAIYAIGVPVRDWKLFDPGTVSDHKTLRGSLTVPGKVKPKPKPVPVPEPTPEPTPPPVPTT